MRTLVRWSIPWTLLAALTACRTDITLPFDDSGEPFTTFSTPATSATCPAANAKTVLIDATHDGGVWWFPQAGSFNQDSAHQGKALATYLRSQGHTVTELGRGAKLPTDSLLKYAVVIRAGYYYDAAHPGYSSADLAAYRAYAGCARTLIVFGEYLRDGRTDMLADSLGIPLTGTLTSTISTFATHAITSGVSSVPYIAGSYLASEPNGIQVLGRLGTGEAVMGLLTTKTAKVFFVGDINGIEQVPQPLVSNLVAWGFQ